MKFENLKNTRDLGGLPTSDGRRVKSGMLIRSGELCGASGNDIEYIKENVGLIVDFRTLTEVRERPDPKIDGVEYVHLPIIREMKAGITREDQAKQATMEEIFRRFANDYEGATVYMENIYRGMLTDDYQVARYAEFVDLAVSNGKKATLWHCMAGKDRAGFASAVLLSALGVPKETIIADYLLTNEFVKETVDGAIKELEANGFYGCGPVIGCFFGAKREYIESVFETADRLFGGFDVFLEKKMGITPEKREYMKDKYLE